MYKYKKNNLFIIHNLEPLTNGEEVNDYIKNILMKSGTFELEEQKDIKINNSSDSEEENEYEKAQTYFISKYKNLLTVNHFIFISDFKENNPYNKFTKKKIEFFLNAIQTNKFTISKAISKKVSDLLKQYSKNEDNIKLEYTEIKGNKRKIIYKGNEDLDFTKKPINVKNQIQLKYNYYVSTGEGKDKLFILIERPGNIIDTCIVAKKKDTMYNIQYSGKKCLSDEEKKFSENMNNIGREFGEFFLDIPICLKNYEISDLEKPNHYDKNGIEFIEFNLRNISKYED